MVVLVMEWNENVQDLIFYHFDDKEEVFFAKANSMLRSSTSQEIMHHISSLKAMGNEFYKERKFVEASEKYEFAIKLCSFVLSATLEEMSLNLEEKSSFIDLVSTINLNLAICLIKRSDFVRAGQSCSLVLQLDDHNVKALYRRAIAALELSRPDLAYIDLTKAIEIDPANQDVKDKLFQIECQLGFPLVGKRKYDKLARTETNKKGKKALCTEEVSRESSRFTTRGSTQMNDEMSKVDLDKTDVIASTEKFSDGDGFVDCPLTSSHTHCSSEDDNSCVSSLSSIGETPQFAEPKFRFSNRHRRGSSIQVSCSTYKELLNRKEICFANGSHASVLRVRVLDHPKQDHEEVMSNSSSMEADDSCPASDTSCSCFGSFEKCGTKTTMGHDPVVIDVEAAVGVYEGTGDRLSSSNLFEFSSPGAKSRGNQRVIGIRKLQLKQRRHNEGFKGRGKVPSSTNRICVCRLSPPFVQCKRGKRKYPPLFSEVFSTSHRSLKRQCVVSQCPWVLPGRDNLGSEESDGFVIHQQVVGMRFQGMEGTLDGGSYPRGVAFERVFRYFGDTIMMGGKKVDGVARPGWRSAGGLEATDSHESHTQSVRELSSECSQADNEDRSVFCF